MKKLSEALKELGIDFSFPIEIRNDNGNVTYYEDSEGYWRGTPRSAICEGKVFEVDGIKYELKALHITAECHEIHDELFATDQSGNGNHAKFNPSQRS